MSSILSDLTIDLEMEAGQAMQVTDLFSTQSMNTPITDMEVEWGVHQARNVGETDVAGAPAIEIAYYISTDTVFDVSDTKMWSFASTSTRLYEAWNGFGVVGGASLHDHDFAGFSAGDYYVFAVVDPDNIVAEADETNNVSEAVHVQIVEASEQDLVVDDAHLNGAVFDLGDTVSVTYGTKNIGETREHNTTGSNPYHVNTTRVWLSTDNVLDASSDTLIFEGTGFNDRTVNLHAGLGVGTYYAFVEVDVLDDYLEGNETNNVSEALQFTIYEDPLLA